MSNNWRRSELWIAHLGTGANQSQVVAIVSRDALNAVSNSLIVVPAVPSKDVPIAQGPSHVSLEKGAANVSEELVLVAELVRAIDGRRLTKLVGRLSNAQVERLNTALQAVLDI